MMKIFLPLILCCLALSAGAQNVQEVIKAEQAFAAYARDNNTRDAFLKFMDAKGLVFSDGEPKNAIENWSAQKAGPAKLLWEPTFAGIAASGELGFTTGPWQFKKTLQDTALASGMFTSVWRKGADGVWKNIVDMGFAFNTSLYKTATIKINKTGKASPAKADVMEIEQQFLDSYNKTGKGAFNKVLTPDSWLNMNGLQPFTTAQQHADAITAIPAGLVMKPLGGGVSASKDIAYVYGVVEYNNKKQNYLRVWQQSGAAWKIALQVIQW